jgi:hypothetical protein
MSNGVNRREAAKIADKTERQERAKSELMKEELKKKKNKEDILKDIHRKLVKEYSKYNLKVWIVNGEIVRDLYFLDFTEGGHNKVYPFVPIDEIWIDDDLSKSELKFVLLHEAYERNLMSQGLVYDEAHKKASEQEFYYRLHPKELDKRINQELKNEK